MSYISLVVTKEQKPIVDTHKKGKKSKHTTMKNHQITKEDSKRGRKEHRNYKKPESNKVAKSSPISNYFK